MKSRFFNKLFTSVFLIFGGLAYSSAQDVVEPHPGEALYAASCANCHDEPFYKAPSSTFLSALGPKNILAVLNDGAMREQALSLIHI